MYIIVVLCYFAFTELIISDEHIVSLIYSRKLEKAHSIALQGYIATPREYYA